MGLLHPVKLTRSCVLNNIKNEYSA